MHCGRETFDADPDLQTHETAGIGCIVLIAATSFIGGFIMGIAAMGGMLG